MPIRIVDGLDIEVLPQPYHMQPTPTPRRRVVPVERLGDPLRCAYPSAGAAHPGIRSSGDTMGEDLARCRRYAGANGVAVTEFEGVEAKLFCQIVVERVPAGWRPAARRSRETRRMAFRWYKSSDWSATLGTR